MFEPEGDRKNDRYGWIDAAAPELLRASRELVDNNEAARVSDEAVAQILTAAIRLYVAKSDGEERTFCPIAGSRDSEMTPTELLSAVSRGVVVIVIGCLRLGTSQPPIIDFSQMKPISWKRRYSSLQSSATKCGWNASCRGTWSRRMGRATAARGSGPRSP